MILKNEEKIALFHMLDDEKLAKNVYSKFYQYYSDIYYFNKIKNSEIVHESCIINVLKNYNVSKNEYKINSTKYLKSLFLDKEKEAVEKGKKNLKEALFISIDIEIEDILDLEKILKNKDLFSDKPDIKEMLNFLLQGSYNHYNMFKKLLKDLYKINICEIDQKKCFNKPFKKEVWVDYKEWYWFEKDVNF